MPIPAGPAASQLVSASDVRAHLNLTDTTQDGELAGFITAAQDVIENIVGPVVPQLVIESFSGGSPQILLTKYPVLAVSEVSEVSGGIARDLAVVGSPYADTTGYAYRVDLDTGLLTRWNGNYASRFACGVDNITVTYTAGRTTVPGAVRLAALRLIEHMWRSQQSRVRLSGSPDQAQPGYLGPYFVEELLEPHKKAPHVG